MLISSIHVGAIVAVMLNGKSYDNEVESVNKEKSSLNELKTEIIVDIPAVNGRTFVKKYGQYSLTKDEQILAYINWSGDGSVMFLYTKEEFSRNDIIRLVDKGILPLNVINKNSKGPFNGLGNVPSFSSNFTYTMQDKELKLNFITTPNKPIYWLNKIPETGRYYIYIIATGDTGITDIQGNIIFMAQSDKSEDGLLTNGLLPNRLTKDQLPTNLKSWIKECDKKQDLYVIFKMTNGIFIVI